MSGIRLDEALEAHSEAVSDLLEIAERVPEADWHTPLTDGKWSPSLLLAHLVASYDVVIRELKGGAGMAIRIGALQRWLLRMTVLRSILSGKGFPSGAVAPRETRPGEGADREASIELFRSRASEFEEAARVAPPERVLTHAYFGRASVGDGVLLCARHIQHHAAQLARRGESPLEA
jgi:hypothetical protein